MRVLLPLFLAMSAFLTACASGGASAHREGTPGKPMFAFTAVNVVTMTPGEPLLRDQTVLVENGRIVAMGPTGSLPVPAGATEIHAEGQYLMPGLADMHVHLEHFDDPVYLNLFLVNGVTMVRSMDGRPNILEWRRRAADGTMLAPQIYTAGQVLDGAPPVRDDNIALATPEDASRVVAEQAAAGYDFIKVYANLSPEVFDAITETASELNLPVAGHKPGMVPLDAFLSSGVRSVEHLGDYAEQIAAASSEGSAPPPSLKRRLGFLADDDRMNSLAEQVAASGVWVVPTMITDERLVARPELVDQWARAPEIASVDRGIVEYWRGSLARAADRVGPDSWQWVLEGRSNRQALLRALHRAGVPIMTGTDTPQPFVFPGSSLHDELAIYVAVGLTPAEALAYATREPARFLGQETDWGTIETGKRANLLLLNGNPLADIAATRRIAGVMLDGRWLPADQLAEMTRQVERIAAASD